ncbi:MAG: ferredoxin [Cyanobacteria bacterium P01_C01_bin.120]
MPQYFDEAFSDDVDENLESSPSGFEPELGGDLGGSSEERTGLEPELGGTARQKGVYVDELTCVGCWNCALVARNTFYMEPDHGRARVIRQDGDPEEVIQEAIDTCPVDCIHWTDYTEIKNLERERQEQVVPVVGFPVEKAIINAERRRQQRRRAREKSRRRSNKY